MGVTMIRWFGLALAALGLGACSIHPAIEDVTSYSSDDVSRKIRCEAREVFTIKLGQWLGRQTDDPAALALSERILADPNSINIADFRPLSKRVRAIIDYVGRGAIAYDFALNITENNAANGTLGLVSPLTPGKATLGFGAGVTLTRTNTSSFLLTDTFIGLLKDIDPRFCIGFQPKGPNFLYPIVGRIGLQKSIDPFVNLVFFANLKGSDKAPPTKSDALEFTTRISGNVTPALVFVPAGGGFNLTDASLTASSYREDKHKVTIGLSLPTDIPPTLPSQQFTGQLVTIPENLTPSEKWAAQAAAQNILRFDIGARSQQPVVVRSLLPFF